MLQPMTARELEADGVVAVIEAGDGLSLVFVYDDATRDRWLAAPVGFPDDGSAGQVLSWGGRLFVFDEAES